MFKFDLQLFGGGGKGDSQSSSSSYQMSDQEKQLANYAVNNAGTAQGGISTLLNQFNSGVNSQGFQNLLGNANNMIASGQNTYASLLNGQLPAEYLQNMTDAVKSGVNSTVGSAVNSLANRGIINSSVSNKALNDIESNVANTMAQQYGNNIGTLAGLAGNQIASATAGYSPYITLANLAGQTQNNFITSPLGSLHNGTTTQSQSTNQGWGSALGTAAAIGSMFI